MAERVWDKIDEEMDAQASSIRRFRDVSGMTRTLGSGRRTLKVRRSHRKQTPATSGVVLMHAERKTGLRSDQTYCKPGSL